MQLSKIAGYTLIGFSYVGGWIWMDYESAISNPTVFDKPVTIEIEKAARSKHIDIVAYIRYAFACPRPKGIVKINTIG